MNVRRLNVEINGAADRTCCSCECQDADEHLLYCGIFRKPLRPEGMHVNRLPECMAAEANAKPATEAR